MGGFLRFLAPLLVAAILNSASCHHRQRGDERKEDHARGHAIVAEASQRDENRLNGEDAKGTVPFSERRLEKMLEKAILKIITGDLSTGDMLLLKSLNYSLEEVLAIRERELSKKRDEEARRKDHAKSSWSKALRNERKSGYWGGSTSKNPDFARNRRVEEFDFEAYNKQAILDYENLDAQQSWSEPEGKEEQAVDVVRREFDRAMEPHVVFKIRYDDSEFDSSSNSDESNKNHPKTSKYHLETTSRNAAGSFQTSTMAPTVATAVPLVYRLTNHSVTTPNTNTESKNENETNINFQVENSTDKMPVSRSNEKTKRVNEYEGLEWVEDDVYRVIPQFVDSLDFENTEENETSDYEDSGYDSRQKWTAEEHENDTSEYQNDAPDSMKLFMANSNASSSNLPLANLSTYLQAAIAHRRGGNVTSSFDSQGEKAIEDIKSRVLALTGRFNVSTDANQVQRERLAMFSPTCQVPRNTDQEAWSDQFSMNMHFQLNLTSNEHVVAAKLRIFKLPQENMTFSSESTFEEEEEDEKKIRISVYYYTKSLKRHRSKKRLMDSVVTPLTSRGTHLALDVRQGLRFWRPNSRNAHGNGSNHGLVIQVEDQDGRPLKPALYIQQPSCLNQDSDQKAYHRLPALFVRACTRYVRIVNGRTETYVNCRH
ncbi:uncharacterized protein LOC143431026 [Xylocopa sonorina]|uniref:uncharacterized protein LOC143431026 n=1 Tax=Xylocopa sonorina TaxID=1818115 RepID=UPI00403B1D5D